MEWKQIHNYKVFSAYDFLTAEDITILIHDCKEKPTSVEVSEVVTWLIEQYGSDSDIIRVTLEKKFPGCRYFWLCDFIDESKRQEEQFHIRVWELLPTTEPEISPEKIYFVCQHGEDSPDPT